MATNFDVTTYPLETSSEFKHGLGTKLDRMSDGSLRIRVTTSNKPVSIKCVFNPQTESESASFLTYLIDNAATNFNITHNGITYAGYIDGDSLTKAVSDGTVHWWSFIFEGNVT